MKTETQVVEEDLVPYFHAESEARLWDGTRVDLLLPGFAIEVDWASKWAEAIGQALYYAAIAQREPAIVLLVKTSVKEERRFVYRALTVSASLGIPVWVWDVQRGRMVGEPAAHPWDVGEDAEEKSG